MTGGAAGRAALRALDKLVEIAVTCLYAVIIVAMFAQVLFRYGIGSPLSWSEEISRYMFIWLCYLGGYIAVLRNAHVGVDYGVRYLPVNWRRGLRIVFALCMSTALAFVAYHGALLTQENAGSPWWTIPFLSLGLAYAAIPVGAVLMLIGVLRSVAGVEAQAPGDEMGGEL